MHEAAEATLQHDKHGAYSGKALGLVQLVIRWGFVVADLLTRKGVCYVCATSMFSLMYRGLGSVEECKTATGAYRGLPH